MSGHTPGPWRDCDAEAHLHTLPSNVAFEVRGIGGEILAAIHFPVVGHAGQRAQANARLIAAVPDLLEAAKALVASCRTPDGVEVPPTIAAVSDLAEAIARAEGR